MATLQQIDDRDMVTQETDVRAYWRVLGPLCRMYNALLNAQVRRDTGKDAFTLTDTNAVLEYKPGATGVTAAAATTHTWQPYAAPWIGGGNPPSNWGLNIMARPGDVWDGVQLWEPSSRNQVFNVPANCVNGYYVWLDATIGAGAQITALDYGSGTEKPAAVDSELDSTGTPPSHAYCILFVVTSTMTAVELTDVDQRQNHSLTIRPQITDYGIGGLERRMFFYAGDNGIIDG